MPKLTKSFIGTLPLTSSGQQFHRDSELTGFGVRVGKTRKTFFVEKRVNGRTVRCSIGQCGHMSVGEARKQAQAMLGQMAQGEDPAKVRAAERALKLTLAEAYEDLTKNRTLRPSTRRNYDRSIEKDLHGWLAIRMVDISREMVMARFAELAKRSPSSANHTMRVLRLVFNYAIATHADSSGKPLVERNPVHVLSQAKLWRKIPRRQTLVTEEQLPRWYEAVQQLDHDSRDFLMILLYTGLRRSEVANLRWQDIDLGARQLVARRTKNGDDLHLPISTQLNEILASRRERSQLGHVFPGRRPGRPLVEVRRAIVDVQERSGVEFTLHDLRRTFVTLAVSLDINVYAVKRLVNHRVTSDVTAGYVVHGADRLRKASQQIADHIDSLVAATSEASNVSYTHPCP